IIDSRHPHLRGHLERIRSFLCGGIVAEIERGGYARRQYLGLDLGGTLLFVAIALLILIDDPQAHEQQQQHRQRYEYRRTPARKDRSDVHDARALGFTLIARPSKRALIVKLLRAASASSI